MSYLLCALNVSQLIESSHLLSDIKPNVNVTHRFSTNTELLCLHYYC